MVHLTSEQVRFKEFELARSGYNPADVQEFLTETASRMQSIENESDPALKEAAGTELISSMLVTVFGQARKGFKPADVDDFIDQLAEQVHEQTGSPVTVKTGMKARIEGARPPSSSWWKRLTGG